MDDKVQQFDSIRDLKILETENFLLIYIFVAQLIFAGSVPAKKTFWKFSFSLAFQKLLVKFFMAQNIVFWISWAFFAICIIFLTKTIFEGF